MRGLLVLLFIGSSLAPNLAQASVEGSVIFVARKLRMSAAEAETPKDFYLNRGTVHGLKSGDSVSVFRDLSVLNGLTGSSVTIIKVKLGQLKILAIGEYSAIARLETFTDPRELPGLEYPGVMLGDSFEVMSSLPLPPENQ